MAGIPLACDRSLVLDQGVLELDLLLVGPDRRQDAVKRLVGWRAEWAPLRDDLVAWQLRPGVAPGLLFPNCREEPWSETDSGNWSVRVWKPLREKLDVTEPP